LGNRRCRRLRALFVRSGKGTGRQCNAMPCRGPTTARTAMAAARYGCDTVQYNKVHENNSIAGVQRAACSKQQQRQRGCSRCLVDSAPAPAPAPASVCVCVGARVAVCHLCSSEFCASAMAITMAIAITITAATANAKPKPNPTATALAGPSTSRVGLLIAGAGLVLVAGQAQSPPSPPARRATSLVLQLSRRRRLPRL
jgi:hypothetical protein